MYEAFWDEHEDCKNFVLGGWNSATNSGGTWEEYMARSKACKNHLISWHKSTFLAAYKEISKLKQELAILNNKPHDNVDWEQVTTLKERINQLWKQEEMFWA